MELTYGFELEGRFKSVLPNMGGVFKPDGSVASMNPRGKAGFISQSSGSEYESPIFRTKTELLDTLSLFKTSIFHENLEYTDIPNHWWDYTCGLHLNIGSNKSLDLMAMACNYNFIDQLREQALEFCEHQKYRLENRNGYCTPILDDISAINRYKNNYKSSFVRFHPERRLEFRFLCPCEHKQENVIKTLEIVENYLNESFTYGINIEQEEEQEIKIIKLLDNHVLHNERA